MGIPWYILALPILAPSVLGATVTRGDSELILNFTTNSSTMYTMIVKENNHIEGSDNLLLFYINEVKSLPTCSFLTTNTFQHQINLIADNQYGFNVTQYFDYETQPDNYQLKCDIDSVVTVVIIRIENYDDEPPTLTSPMCSMKENVLYTEDNTNCTCILQDPDGFLSKTTFTIINSDPSATKDLNMEDKLFKFDFDRTIDDYTYNTTVYITTLQTLDYETKIFYSFSVQARDGANHPTTPKEDVSCIIDVVDQNDQPPQWTDYFSTKEITEEEARTFNVTAVDGDRGINAEIKYYLVSYDPKVCGEDPCVSIDTKDGKGIITVDPIDRDAMDLMTYKFEIMAQEQDDPPYTANTTITFFIDDIDDNSPLFMSLTTTNATNMDYTVEPKIANFTFYENFAGTIDGEIEIKDIDTGENARFNVVLMEDESQESTVQYTDAFIVVPTAGYRKGIFQISVKNVTYLDYENPPWQNFGFYVHSSGDLNETKTDDLLINIHLLDYNDEKPIFELSTYTVSVNETIGKGEEIIQVKATDRDAEDATLTHQLVGADTILRLLEIDTTEGIIKVAVDNAFDYDRINPISFQVKAIDHAKPPHETLVPVIVTLLDINNKAPTYIVKDVIRVDENQVIGIPLNATITASDVDTTRNLTAEIDWDSSYVTKNSQRLKNSNPVIKKAMQFLDLSYEKVTEDTISIELTVSANNANQTAPDYETFDTLYLDIRITDLNTKLPEFADKMTIDALIVININDINDNPPIFTEDTIKRNRTVYERSKADTIVGTIEAIDADVGDNVTYSCKYKIEEYDWFTCSSVGVLTVTETEQIDCDTDQLYYANISCDATDGFFHTLQDFAIYILDTNNQYPQIEVNDTSPSTTEVKVFEKSEQYTVVTDVGYSDADRDPPFHAATCTFQETTEACYEQFFVKNNQVLVKNAGHKLDRDGGLKDYDCTVTCTDNMRNEQGEPQRSNYTVFKITLLDINDNCPELQTFELTVSENIKKDTLIGDVIAKDIDEGDNAEIVISILTVTKDDDGEDYTDKSLFTMIKQDDDYKLNDTYKQWHLVANSGLRDFYGEYTLQLQLNDLGTPPQSTEDPENEELKETSKINLTISKYNYYPPIFVFPGKDDTNLVLSSDQEVGKQLVKYLNNELLPNIQITDGANDKCINKWEPTFEVELTGSSSDLVNFFVIKSISTCVAQLQINENYKKGATTTYEVTITTKLSDNTPSDSSEAAYTESVKLSISFADPTGDPIFDQTLGAWKISMPEADASVTVALPKERKAYYPNVDVEVTVFYSLYTDNKNISDTFEVEINKGTISLKRELDYLEETNYEFEILAARNQSKETNPDKLSRLSVTLSVEDVNNHVPQFTQDTFFGAIMKSTTKGTTILSVTATDLDVIDKDKLTYNISSEIEKIGSESIRNIQDPFKLDKTTAALALNFLVDYNMEGHFFFTVTVVDVQDRFGNGPHANETTVTIYIVTMDNTLTFRFENDLDTVVARKEEVTDTISEALGWACHDYSIDRDSQNGVVLDNVTACDIYCVDNNTLLTSSDIKAKLNNINTFKAVKQGLLQYGVLLQSFDPDGTSTAENLEATLKAALIGVSVVLGAICIILGVTFFLKARELNRRLKHLTEQKFGSDESNLNRKGINAPTTNVFAVEGSNPVFNNDIKRDDLIDYDKRSVTSGDSELIGVEDSPEFDEIFKINNNQERF